MFAVFFAGLLFWCLQKNAVGAELAAPHNVNMVTLNTNYTLTWDWDQSTAVNFTTEYVAMYKLKLAKKKKSPNWITVCEKTSRRLCDLTKFDLHYLGIYMLRVRASVNGQHSAWVQKEFCPDKDAALGPPTRVNVSFSGSIVDVFISDPMTSNNISMREKLSKLYFDIVYWEGVTHSQPSGAQTLSTSTSLVTLSNLKPWTWYCVTVQSRYDFYNKSSNFTVPQCGRTEGPTAWWLISLYFLGSLVICFTVVLLALFGLFETYKTIKATFFPSDQLPPHFKKYFCSSPASDIPRLLTPDSQSELLCDNMIVCPEPVLEIHNPPAEALLPPPSGLEPDSSGRHSRQGSSSSGDSGVYSTGGSAGLPNTGQSLHGVLHSERVKMQDMVPVLKSQPLMTDEGIVDMCV